MTLSGVEFLHRLSLHALPQGFKLLCIGRLDARGKFTPLAEGARRARIQVGEPPAIADTS